MKSIRVSLIVYFLSLLLLGLGGVSVLAYRTAADTLRAKEANGRVILELEFESREQDLRKELDDAILRKAKQVILRQSKPPYRWLNVLPILATPATSMGYLNLAADLRMGVPWGRRDLTPWQLRFQENRTLDQLVSAADDWSADDDGHPWECCQMFFRNGETKDRSNNLAFLPFALDEQFRESAELMQERFDDLTHGGRTLRRVSIKVPRPSGAIPPGPGPGNPSPKGGPRGPALTQNQLRAMTEQFFFIQYAVETTPLANRLAKMTEQRNQRIARLSEETRITLQNLRERLFTLCGLTVVSVFVGGLILIWMGLAPLHRLSEAVSRINEKDFQLRLDPQSLPTELQPVAHRLRHSLDQLRQAFAREKQAAQDLSHDLRTPLAALTTTIEVALKKDRSTAEYRELLEECQLSANQMSHLVERLLALAKIDAGSNPVRPRPIDVAQVAHHAADLVRPLAKARAITMTVHAPAELPMVADADKLCEVLTNLLHNAVDYNRDAGTIDLFVERDGDAVELRVADTGAGIRFEAREHLFERFYRADPSRNSDTPHCGLGLAIVKSYVDLMKGTISVESQPGQGTTFRIRLPYVGPPVDLESALAASSRNEVLA